MIMFLRRVYQELRYIGRSHITNRNWTLEEVGKFWDSVADYDDINEQTYSYFRRFVDGYKLCSIPDKSYILDICARTGNGTKYFYTKGKVKKAICADVSNVFQDICTKNLSVTEIDFETHLFHTYQLPFKDNEFDAILCFETIEHVSNPQALLHELYRVLKNKGEMILTCPNILWEPIHSIAAITNYHHSEGPHRFLTKRSLFKKILEAGFSIAKETSTVIVPGGPKIFIRFGEYLERVLPSKLVSLIALRRVFICRKQ